MAQQDGASWNEIGMVAVAIMAVIMFGSVLHTIWTDPVQHSSAIVALASTAAAACLIVLLFGVLIKVSTYKPQK